MKMKKRTLPRPKWSKGLIVTLMLLGLSAVDANVFSRLLKVGEKKEDNKSQAPSGVAAATGSEAQLGGMVSFDDGVMKAHLFPRKSRGYECYLAIDMRYTAAIVTQG